MNVTFPRAFVAAALLALPLLPAQAFELTHSKGVLSLDAPPQRVVSFDLATLDTLAVLDVPVAGVPRSTYKGHMARYQTVPVVGTLFEPDYDALHEVKPDLIVSGRRSMPAVPELQKRAPTIDFAPDPLAFLDSFRNTNRALGEAFGKQAQAEAALAAIDRNIRALHAVNAGRSAAMLFTVKDTIIAHAPGDRYGYVYELAGLKSVLPAADPNAPVPPRPEPGSPEAKAAAEKRAKTLSDIAAAEPDWLIVLDRSAINGAERTAANTLAKHPQLSQTRAFKEGRVHYVDPDAWYLVGGGLNTMLNITESMLAAMK
ncbi:ABC transporter substrate-binding protein [bacterium SGD-2]|nr:ABC transporter substrate-binding protein [bacterium SGD-2]